MVKLNPEFIKEELFKKYHVLDSYLEIENLDVLRRELCSFRKNDKFIFVSKEFNERNNIYRFRNKIKICSDADDIFGTFSLVTSNSKLDVIHVEAIFGIIEYSCAAELQRKLSMDEKEKIYYCDLVYKLSCGQENFLQVTDYDFVNKNFFKKLKDIRWGNNAKDLHKKITNGLWLLICSDLDTGPGVGNSFSASSKYFACCRALTHNRSEISVEDVVQSWLFTLKLFSMDLRPLIKDFPLENNLPQSIDEKNTEPQINEGDVHKNNPSLIRKVFAAVVSVVLMVLILLAIGIVFLLIVGDFDYHVLPRSAGLLCLAIWVALTKKFYDYLIQKLSK